MSFWGPQGAFLLGHKRATKAGTLARLVLAMCSLTLAACQCQGPRLNDVMTCVEETCDGLDNDCDGTVDNGVCVPPTVSCPQSQSVRVGTPVSLQAMAAAATTGVASVGWTVTARPQGSTATISTSTTVNTGLIPDADGVFALSFCATGGDGVQACCTTAINTSSCASPPTPPASTACGTSWDGRPIVQFEPVPVGLRYELSKAGNSMVLASAKAHANHMRPQIRIDPGAPPPGSRVALELRACRVEEAACCSSPTALEVEVVSECTTPTTPTADNIIFSEYVTNGQESCGGSNCSCQAGESIEITNLSSCPVSLQGYHFAYRNGAATPASYRWMNFGPDDIIPPRGVYVAIRERALARTCAGSLGPERPGLFGLNISRLNMQGDNLCSGWFNNSGGALSELRLAPGAVAGGSSLSFEASTALARVAPYQPAPVCEGIGFDAVDSCGSVQGGTTPTKTLAPNQLGRLWHPCDAVVNPVPACVRD